jgi:hypothetical protein
MMRHLCRTGKKLQPGTTVTTATTPRISSIRPASGRSLARVAVAFKNHIPGGGCA